MSYPSLHLFSGRSTTRPVAGGRVASSTAAAGPDDSVNQVKGISSGPKWWVSSTKKWESLVMATLILFFLVWDSNPNQLFFLGIKD
jgi:hypothetical protein